jgi:hypothetical protein
MSGIWITKAGSLGIVAAQDYFELQLQGQDLDAGPVNYSLIAGELPSGLTITSGGFISGNPVTDSNTVEIEKFTTKEFTVRLSTNDGAVNDRAFSLSVSSISAPVIDPSSTSLGTYIAGEYANLLLTASDTLVSSDVVFSLASGTLPPGIQLYANGAIQGYILPISNNQQATTAGFDLSEFDLYLLDYAGVSTSRNYQFRIAASDGVNEDLETYTIYVYDRSALTADTDIITADNIGVVTADDTTLYDPILYTEPGIIGNIKAQDNFAYQLYAIDLDGDDLSYNITNGALPTGISLSTDTGWITGQVAQANLNYTDYTFTAQAYKTDDSDYNSDEKVYTIRLLGQLNDSITWATEANLGTIYAGEVSELALTAIPSNNQALNYKLASNSLGTLPPGLDLTSNGLIIGRPSFYESNYVYANLVSNFTVVPYNQNTEYSDSSRTFRLQVVKRTATPYENLYINLLPQLDQRQIFDNILNNQNIATEDILYRPSDLWFGRNNSAKVLFLAGLEENTATEYINAMTLNHYWKTLLFGDIKTAKATDDNLNTTYEVVYIEIIDQQVNQDGLGPNLAIQWPTNQENINNVYPNSFTNMVKRLETNIGYEDKGVLPSWMTSRQADGRVLGFTRALVLYYTLPDQSEKVAFRVRQYLDQFNLINFTIDRYEWDTSLTLNPFVNATGLISGNIESNLITGNTGNAVCSGFISGSTNSQYVTGLNTLFATELQKDSLIYVSSALIGTVERIYSNTNLQLSSNSLSTFSTQAFTTKVITTKFDSELKLGDTILVNDDVIGTVKTINSASSLTLFANSSANIADAKFSHVQQDLYLTPGKGTEYLKFPQTNILS